MENISLRILEICIFLLATDLHSVQLEPVEDPCPDYIDSTTIADMCTTDFAIEGDHYGSLSVDSIAVRIMAQQDGCTCEVSLQYQNDISIINMQKFDGSIHSAPEHQSCGLVIDIDYFVPNNYDEKKNPIACTNGTDTRAITLSQNGVLTLKSRIIGGSFSRGYCMQIYRYNPAGDNQNLQVNCSQPSKTKPDEMTDSKSTLYIAISASSVGVLIILVTVVVIRIIRRNSNKNEHGTDAQTDNECNDSDSVELKYNTLYNASGQQDIMEGDYHTVDVERKQNRIGIQKLGSDNSVVDGKYSSVEKVDMPAKDGSKTDNISNLTPTTSPKSKTQRTEEDIRNDFKHVTAGSKVEYAVVDKSRRTEKNINTIKHVTVPNDSNVEYAVIDKKINVCMIKAVCRTLILLPLQFPH